MPPFNAPSWIKLISSVVTDAKFMNSAKASEIALAEKELGIALPQDLRELLSESDGVWANCGAHVIWSAAEIRQRNHEYRRNEFFRNLYMPFDNLLFFGEDGGGDQFAFAIDADGNIHKRDIYRWEHETDARSWSAGHLEQFFTQQLFK